jgi:hypothetical protein
MVDAMLVHHYPQAYDAATAGTGCCRARGGRGTLAGLRFVRNRIGGQADLAGFIKPGAAGPDPARGHITGWAWKTVPEPALGSLGPRGRAWEATRYRAYQVHLAGHTIAETFGRAAGSSSWPPRTRPRSRTGRKAWLDDTGDDKAIPHRLVSDGAAICRDDSGQTWEPQRLRPR